MWINTERYLRMTWREGKKASHKTDVHYYSICVKEIHLFVNARKYLKRKSNKPLIVNPEMRFRGRNKGFSLLGLYMCV